MSPRISGLRAFMAVLLILVSALPASAQEVVTVTTPRGATVKYLALAPDGSIGSTLVNNFLIRSRQLFVDNGLYVAAVDAPSDHATGLSMSYRLEFEHAKDVRQVIASVKTRVNAPVWLVGTSAGTLSAANAASRGLIQPPAPPKGVVLTSTLTHKTLGCPKSVTEAALAQIKMPVLVVSHRDDACACTPSVDADALVAKLTSATAKEAKVFPGGDPPVSAPCQAKSQHGYFGIEATVVAAIADWIKSH